MGTIKNFFPQIWDFFRFLKKDRRGLPSCPPPPPALFARLSSRHSICLNIGFLYLSFCFSENLYQSESTENVSSDAHMKTC